MQHVWGLLNLALPSGGKHENVIMGQIKNALNFALQYALSIKLG